MKDYVLRATAADKQIRAFVATSKYLVDKAATIHKTSAVATAALGRSLTAAAVMGLMLGNDDHSLTINIRGDGPLRGVLVVTDGLGNVRGYVNNPVVDIEDRPDGKLNVGGAVGSGQLTVAKDLGLKEPYVGTTPLVSGEIAEDLAAYFMHSEQTPSIISLGVMVDVDLSVKAAGGFFIQLLPGASDEIIDQLEAHIQGFPPISRLLDEQKSPEDILELLLAPFGYEITETHPIAFVCNCAKERMERTLISLGIDEIKSILEEQGQAEISCHFCSESYCFTENELTQLIGGLQST
ncbi:MAG: Hsp33 family molecular chaperone HslO [Defluviitaleaceae bacterium]|nr:Hsp33 family molecular chaperone HslO [Defluviitaleaceae bacterium]